MDSVRPVSYPPSSVEFYYGSLAPNDISSSVRTTGSFSGDPTGRQSGQQQPLNGEWQSAGEPLLNSGDFGMELSDEGKWKVIQQNTFTRWVNEHLRSMDMAVVNLETDLSDGVLLINLIQVLSGKRIAGYTKKPHIRTQKLENVSLALKMLDKEGVKLVNIGSTDIVDSSLKLILGLIWTLILHYSISMPMWDEGQEGREAPKETPKQRLLGWVQAKIPGVKVSNFSTDWNDGMALGALVNSVAPGLLPNLPKWHRANALSNTTEAMNAADKWLGVPKLIEPHELVNPKVDEMSVMTYLSQYPNAKVRSDAPIGGRGPPAKLSDSAKVNVAGPGLEPGVTVGKSTFFEIYTKDAGEAVPQVIILDSSGHSDQVRPVVRRVSDNAYRCDYVAGKPGLHSINVLYGEDPIPKSPFEVRVMPASDPRSVRVFGRGVQPKGVRVGDTADFRVVTEGAGEGEVDVVVLGPTGSLVPLEKNRLDPRTVHYAYSPKHLGRHSVNVRYGGQEIPKSPITVDVGPQIYSRLKAFGPGLWGGQSNLPCDFTVETNGEAGVLGFSIEGPSQAKIHCTDNGDGSAEVSYLPTAPGEYAVHILCNEEDIPDSPFMVEILPFMEGVQPSQVRCMGPGLEKRGVMRGQRADFIVDTKNAGVAPLKLLCIDKNYEPVDLTVIDRNDATYACSYVPKSASKHHVVVSYGGVAVPGSPYKILVQEPVDPSKVYVHGPGVGDGVKSQTPTHFIIDCKQAGPGEVEVALSDDKGAPVDIDVMDNSDGSFTVKYTAPRPGPYQVRVVFAGNEIPGSPIRLNVQPHLDVGGIRVEGLDNKVFVDASAEFKVDAKSVSRHGGPNKVVCLLTTPSGPTTQAAVVDNCDGTYQVLYTPFEEGVYRIQVFYENIPLPQCPQVVYATAGCDASRVRAKGSGLERGFVGVPCQFLVETKGAGTGGLGLSIEGPSEAKMTCKDNRDGSCLVEYTPMMPGDYEISIKFAERHIPGSPFKVLIDYPVDATKVFASGPGLDPKNCRANVPLNFYVDASLSGYAPLNVDVKTEKNVAAVILPEIREKENNNYEVVYYPTPEGTTCVITVTYGGKDIVASPFKMKVLPTIEPDKVKVSGEGVAATKGLPASLPVTFTVDATQAGFANLEVSVVGPDGLPCPVKVLDRADGVYDVTYVPEDPGQYSIVVKYGGKEVNRSPYRVKAQTVGDASKCFITDGRIEAVAINEEYQITVDTREAGPGRVTCRIQPNHTGSVPLDLEIDDNRDGTYSIYYTPVIAEQHVVVIKFGGAPIPNGQYSIWADKKENLKQSRPQLNGLQPQSDLPPIEFWNIPLLEDKGQLEAFVIMPSKSTDLPVIKENHDGSVTVKYQPKEKGLHEMHIKYNNAHVQGSPFQFHVDSVKDGYVTAYGPGLIYGSAGEPANFTVCAKEAGAGGLSISVEGPAKAEIKCHDNKDGTCSVQWIPPGPGEYKIHVKFAEKDIHGSPFTSKIAGEGRKRSHISVGSTSEVSLKIAEPDIKGLSASIKSPSGIEEPCFIRKLDEGHLGISFTPREVGEHLVAVKKKGTLLPNAPFRIHVGESEVGNASKVKVTGPGIDGAHTQTYNEFTVDTKGAGFGGLSISVEGPSKCEIQCKDNKDGTCKILYQPTEPGIYVVSVKFADHHVPGSPFTVHCVGAGVGTVSEIVKKQQTQAAIVSVGQDCELCLKIPGANPMDMSARMITPEGKGEDIEIADVGDGQFIIKFKSAESGLHTVSVMHKGQHISGSPFQFTVGPFKEGGSHKVRAGGPGLVRGEVNIPVSFNIYSREAGAGNLSIAVEGPSKAEIDFKDHKDGNCYVLYKVAKPGNYAVSVKFNEQHIPDSPFKVFISPSTGEARKLEIASFPDMGLQLNKPVNFTVLKRGAVGHLDAKVVAPSGAEDDCFITPIEEGESYAVRFIPKEAGNHYVHIKLDGTHMADSPFRVRVGGKDETDPTAVTASGEGLKGGETGQKCEFILNTCNAGAGPLQVSVDGPSKVTLDAYEVDIGYKVRYTPLAPGDYYFTVKFNGVHIPGSPFKVNISGKSFGGSGYNENATVNIQAVAKSGKGAAQDAVPKFKGDASKVECKGQGIKKAFVGRQNMFQVDASKAGQDLLWVAVATPKGPVDELVVKHTGRGNYTVNYLLKTRDATHIYIKYGDKHIPGSPFPVEI